jgi:hypothetical protein
MFPGVPRVRTQPAAPVWLDGITSIATSLGALQASERSVRLAQVCLA